MWVKKNQVTNIKNIQNIERRGDFIGHRRTSDNDWLLNGNGEESSNWPCLNDSHNNDQIIRNLNENKDKLPE